MRSHTSRAYGQDLDGGIDHLKPLFGRNRYNVMVAPETVTGFTFKTMNTSFTPGPWIMTEEGEDDLVVCSTRGDFICTPSGATFGEAVDNARLIAAAPDLYAALHNLVARGLIDTNGDHYDEAIEALNLATGQEP